MPKHKPQPAGLPDILRDFLARYAPVGDSVPNMLVAVSGGVDSMALLTAARELASRGTIKLCAAHLIHHPESDEAAFRAKLVRDFCLNHDISLIVDKIKVKGDQGQSPEERMRQERYRFLEEAARRYSCDYILTGHHADDQAETVLLRVLSGTGLRGLAGIPSRRGMILRPFLLVRKSELIQYCRNKRVPYSEDPSNQDLQITRNLIRHELLPLIEEKLNPDAAGALCRLSRWTSEANEVLGKEISACWEKSLLNFQKGKIILDLGVILTYFTLIQKYTILKAVSEAAGVEVHLFAADLDRIAEFLRSSRTGSYLEFPGGIRIVRDRRALNIYTDPVSELSCQLTAGRDQDIPELSLRAVWKESGSEPFMVGDGLTADINLGSGPCELIFRYAEEGDRFFPLGSPGEKRLFRFLMDRKVSRFDKRTTPVLVKDDEIIWVIGHRISERVRVHPESDGIWRLSLVPIQGGSGL